ncbi:MAG: VWA domain-containing protein [Thalassobaculales bacterium]
MTGGGAAPALDSPASDGRLLDNLMHFARVLRAAGLPVGPGRVLDAARAVEAVGLASRRDLYWTLHSVFVNRRDQRPVFDQAFHVFWKNPNILEKMMALVMPSFRSGEEQAAAVSRRVAEALHGGLDLPEMAPKVEETKVEVDAALTFSDAERLQQQDFEQMSGEELERARAAIRRLSLPVAPRPTRRFAPAARGRRPDPRATFRASLRQGGGSIALAWRAPRVRVPPLVVLCDISGSMSRYSRMMLHFLHALTNDRDRVFSFVFGTRLTNITRDLRRRDVDEALARIGRHVEDWSGGTRIGAALAAFNRDWSRRVLGQGASVLLITDGLDRDAGSGLSHEMERLHKSCRRLIWLNPLLRFDGFAPKSRGVRSMLPHVDEFRTVHNLQSLADLSLALSRPAPPRLSAALAWRERLADA